jgi:hypothetical protein
VAHTGSSPGRTRTRLVAEIELMSNYTEREITNQFEDLVDQTAISDTLAPAVEWRESDPMAWNETLISRH